jgi:hypothetical protein
MSAASVSSKDRFGRTAAARRPAEAFLERPVFGIKRPFSNAWGIRGPRGGHISIQRRRRDAEAVCNLSHADVGIGEHRLGGPGAGFYVPVEMEDDHEKRDFVSS